MRDVTDLGIRKDAFTQRGAAQEGMYIKEQEIEKYIFFHWDLYYDANPGRMKRLREKLRESRKHMEELDKHLYGRPFLSCGSRCGNTNKLFSEEYAKTQGGEQG